MRWIQQLRVTDRSEPREMLHERVSAPQGAPRIEALPMPHQIPRLADFRFHHKSSLVSMVVIRGAVRAFDFAIVDCVRLAIALLYVDEPIVVGNAAFLSAVIGTGIATVAAFELLQLYSLPASAVPPPDAARAPWLDGDLRAAHRGIVLPQSGTRVLRRLVRALVLCRRGRADGRAVRC